MRIAVAGGTGAVGRHVVDVVRERGHEPVVLARSQGIDLVTGVGLAEALQGVTAVIDVASVQTQSADASKQFFGTVTTNLLQAEKAAGVAHHVALSIVGSDKAPYGYYAGKAEQERVVAAGDVPWTLLRATQFHEFAAQMHGQIMVGPLMLVPRMRSRPIAAREVAERLVELATGVPAGRVRDLVGPEERRMADMVRAYSAAIGGRGRIVEVPLPGGFGRALRDGTLLGEADVDHGVQTYEEWLAALPGA
ncbi:uncharacterized protein YbjT (DUF2867 family) [Homoserinimonas aerilata]|uniref:Uncharacterized protein YbjT (DUF2867 family) n=1 Tax=Homoserinimonas aerilata TaxID=1162970 RepID=A0A542YG73_9MICO|nr:NAD(P)H-binding protein [Homoserinimonas aerilata]TQL47075.1 uncharacterized protein YbjT (DUF2867 family) [Homoserinimonas aerilata]